jgi:chemosensory pili system protein ChpA (sensor histidine kinase/response regulator)
MAEVAAPAPEISEETQRLLATDANELDRELLEIYLFEAAEVLDSIAEHEALLKANPGDREALRTVRRGFHTLKGSGRMVGLTQLGDYAHDVEKVMNRLLEEERPVTPALVELIGVAERDFRQWIGMLTQSGRVVADPRELHAAIHAVEAGLPGGGATPAAPEAVPDRPPVASNVIELLKPAPVVAAAAPHFPDLIELPELGFAEPDHAGDAGPGTEAVETIEMIDVPAPPPPSAPELKLVPEARTHVAAETEAVVPAPEVPAEDITIGDVKLSMSLWKILCEEADEHLSTLQHELSVLQFDPRALPSAAMVRASHTLCGIHRTGGFPMVAVTAKALEQTMIGLEQNGVPLPGAAQPVLGRAIAGLGQFVQRVKDREPFRADDAEEARLIQAELDELRQGAAAGPLDAEIEAAAVARLEDEDARAPQPADNDLGTGAESRAPPGADAATGTELHVVAAVPGEPVTVAPAPPPLHVVTAAGEIPATAVARPPASVADDAAAAGVQLALAQEDPLATIRDDVDTQVLPIFLDEAAELFPRAGEELRAWRRNPNDGKAVAELRRTLHTFKGSARMAGAMRLGELTHLLESHLEDADLPANATPQMFEALETELDHIAYLLDRLRQGETNTPLPWVAAEAEESPAEISAEELPVETPVAAAAPDMPAPPIAERPVVVAIPTQQAAPAATAPAVEAVAELETGSRAQLRVRADIIDRLVNEAGEVAIARARVEGELRSLKSNLLELTSSVIRLRTQMREIEIQAESQIQSQMSLMQEQPSDFDPLEFDRYTRFQELTRSLAEGINDVSTVQQALLKNLDDADAALLAQARLSRDVQQRLFSIRTVPFGSLSERLYRILRATAKELGKRANLDIHGAKVELDRSVLEKLVGPLEHLLRNALDHGIEPRDVRRLAGKEETGQISLTVRQVGNEVVIDIADDGAGVDFERIRAQARAQSLVAADAVPTDGQLVELLFQPGFSTASKVTQISGRGIGMDVVRTEIAALGGRVEVATTLGKGTRFTLTLPLTLAVAQAVLVRAGGRLWALPAPMVEQVQQIKSQVLLDLYIQRKVEWQGRSYPFHYLPRLLGDTAHNPETLRYNAVLLLRSGQSYAAIHVDEMVGNQEVVVKNIGPQLARVSGISGATVLGSGEIVLIINPVQLAGRADVPKYDPGDAERTIGDRPRAPATVVSVQPLVMIVDDSMTVRKITSRLLQREGFAVTAAKDGVDALQLLAEQVPDVILLDIEMPRMDGFEFAKTIKSDPRYVNIPIIMITSRTAEKHRSRAAELGVDLYLGKPYQEEKLLAHLREITGVTASA